MATITETVRLLDGTIELRTYEVSAPRVIPDRVTSTALKIALTRAGHRAAVEAAIAAMAAADPFTEAVDLWKGATHFQRSYPLWDQMAGPLGLTTSDVDAVFQAAASIDAEFSQQ